MAAGRAAHAIWKGSISFGLVSIPVSLLSATESHDLSFSMLDKRDKAPVGYRRYNKATGAEVPWDAIVKGYEYEKGHYVIVDEQDFRRANVEATQTVDITAFVEQDQIDPVYYETPYYLEPEKRGAKAYALLREALRRTRKVGVASVVIRSRQHLAVLFPREHVLVLDLLRFPHELRDLGTVSAPEIAPRPSELAMAERLIDAMVGTFEPAAYKDEYHDQLLALIEHKAASGETAVARTEGPPARGGKVLDLMQLLKDSVAQGGRPRATRARAKRKPARKKRARKSGGGHAALAGGARRRRAD
jgi:DNA end-binding protein Ku